MSFALGDGRASVRSLLYFIALLASLLGSANPAGAEEEPRQAMDDAWWTGPLLTLPASTIPAGSWVFATFLWDEVGTGQIDAVGHRTDMPTENKYGFLPLALYGVTDELNLGFFPVFGFDQTAGGDTSSGPELGDWILQAQYRLTEFHEGSWLPTIAVNIGETFPTGRFDRLTRMGDGLGAGAYGTSLALYTQSWFWMPTGRILRVNLNASYTVNASAGLSGRSVYGTDAGFSGRAYPGSSLFVDFGFEYSLTRQWVAMAEFAYAHEGNTRVSGRDATSQAVLSNSGTGEAFYIAPSLVYNFTANKGLTFGVRVFAGGRNETVTTMPMLVFDYYLAPEG